MVSQGISRAGPVGPLLAFLDGASEAAFMRSFNQQRHIQDRVTYSMIIAGNLLFTSKMVRQARWSTLLLLVAEAAGAAGLLLLHKRWPGAYLRWRSAIVGALYCTHTMVGSGGAAACCPLLCSAAGAGGSARLVLLYALPALARPTCIDARVRPPALAHSPRPAPPSPAMSDSAHSTLQSSVYHQPIEYSPTCLGSMLYFWVHEAFCNLIPW